MSKKRRKRRDRRPNIPTDAIRAVSPTESKPVLGPQPSGQDFNPDYTYVIKDLRRIGALAGTFIGILIILSIFLR